MSGRERESSESQDESSVQSIHRHIIISGVAHNVRHTKLKYEIQQRCWFNSAITINIMATTLWQQSTHIVHTKFTF